ncbi:S-layer homology domain-containing protein [Peptoniphilus indolicus]|uniref:Surface layer protein n=2 Tax=Peptoniphilus indolicus TaxID=33030 RepID=G4D4Y4_9FIRM|nr:S-layer homology domain-containing protein [Peptoniphilus indolicus]EGY79432.1 surface layer protein [Peptoniphilus indolicus ATCC 29427]SUB74588.1 Hexagonal wall protein [Peptoniphilus indolicus]
MNKKLLSLVLTLVMVLGAFTSVFAAETKTTEKVEKITGKDNKIQYVVDKKLVEGYEDGSLGLDKNITRAEITKLLAIANGNKDLAAKLQGAMKLYSDVDNSHWANGVITVGTTVPSATNGQPMLQGYPDGSFKPENNVTYAELAKMLVVLVKTDLTADMVKEANAKWAGLWLTWAQQLGILDDVTVADSNAAANRGDAFTMVYNALYKMKNFRRTAANEKLGVLSSLNRDKLVLNQDAKEQEYTITTDTVFVNTAALDRSNVVKVYNLSNPNYYLGSLVRVITNDKKEVTHILELGNPRELALEESRWNGVAEKVAETGYTDVASLKDTRVENGYVNIKLDKDGLKAKTIEFVRGVAGDNVTLDLTNDTKFFVANPANNIMRQVKDVNEAISLIGYRHLDRVPNVYAGYDVNGHKAVVDAFNQRDARTAKVVVFNVVAKSAKAEMFRVVNQASSLGNTTLEDTDGKLVERNFLNNTKAFPYNYGDLYDVIKVQYNDRLTTVIDHSKTNDFPIVEVRGFANDKRIINIVDKYGDMSSLDVRDADIFNAKQYKDLRVGDKLQFARKDNKVTTEIEVLSILPANTALEGAIKGMFTTISDRTHVGKVVITRNFSPNESIVVMNEARDNFNADAKDNTRTYLVATSDLDKLAKLAKTDVKVEYEVRFTDDRNVDGRIYNFITDLEKAVKDLEADKVAKELKEAKAELQTVIDKAEKVKSGVEKAANEDAVKAGTKWAPEEAFTKLDEAIAKAKEALAKEKAEEVKAGVKPLQEAIDAFEIAVKTK